MKFGESKHRISHFVSLTVPLLLQLLVLNTYQGQLALVERRHFPHLLQSLTVTQLTPTHLKTMFNNG